MPSQPRIFRPGGARTRADARRAYDATRRDRHAWRAWYGLARWHRTRARQLRDHPLCAKCDEEGLVVPATVCDHVERHDGDEEKFWAGPFQSLCKPCHDRTKQAEEAAARRPAPWPVGGGGASKV